MDHIDILDDAMYKHIPLRIYTKERGIISGTPYCVDEFDSDPDRLGYGLDISDSEVDTIFLDEIVAITVIGKQKTLQPAV